MDPVLDIDNLVVEIQSRHGVVTPVDGVSLRVEAGETLGIVGESGCGKSMTGLAIMQLLPNGGRVAGGHIRLGGRDLTQLSAGDMREIRGNDIGMIFQDQMT